MRWCVWVCAVLAMAGCALSGVTSVPIDSGVLVAVGAGGCIARSVDNGKSWEVTLGNPNLPRSNTLKGNYIIDGNLNVTGKFNNGQDQQLYQNAAAAGQVGSAATPFFGDFYVRGRLWQGMGTQWSALITNGFAGTPIYAVAYGGGNFVAVGSGGKIEYSTTLGATWTPVVGASNPFAVGDSIVAVTYGNGLFVAFSNGTKVAYSSNYGVSWTLGTSPFTGSGYCVAYGVGIFVAGGSSAVGAGVIAYSTDGNTWATVTNPFGAGSTVYSMSYGNGWFVAGGTGAKIAISNTPQTSWGSLITNPFGGTIDAIAFGNGVFVGTDSNGVIAYSVSNGATWTTATNPLGATQIDSAVYSFGVFQIGNTTGGTAVSYDTGKTWSVVINPFGTDIIFGIASSPSIAGTGWTSGGTGVMAAVGAAGKIATSSWNPVPMLKEILYTPTFTGFGTPTNVNFSFNRAGNRMKVMGSFTCGISTAVTAKVSLPGSLLSDSVLISASVRQVCGICSVGVNAAQAMYMLVDPNVNYVCIGIQAAGSNGLAEANGSTIASNGNGVAMQFEIPISGWDWA
jgi:hypothetical protein